MQLDDAKCQMEAVSPLPPLPHSPTLLVSYEINQAAIEYENICTAIYLRLKAWSARLTHSEHTRNSFYLNQEILHLLRSKCAQIKQALLHAACSGYLPAIRFRFSGSVVQTLRMLKDIYVYMIKFNNFNVIATMKTICTHPLTS